MLKTEEQAFEMVTRAHDHNVRNRRNRVQRLKGILEPSYFYVLTDFKKLREPDFDFACYIINPYKGGVAGDPGFYVGHIDSITGEMYFVNDWF